MRGFHKCVCPALPLGGVDPVDLAGPAPHGINMGLEEFTQHPAFVYLKPLQLRLRRSKFLLKYRNFEFLWVTWQQSGCSVSFPPSWKWAWRKIPWHLEAWSLGKSVTLLYLLLSRLSVCLECLCRQSAAIQGSIYSNLLCLERQPSWIHEKGAFQTPS